MDAEWKRLRQDFELQASQYPDLTLTVFCVIRNRPTENKSFRKPNHCISLWQYMGNTTPETNIEEFVPTKFGLTNAVVSAFGVIEGQDTQRFRRMAFRAGSLLSEPYILKVSTEIMDKVVDPEWPGKPTFVCNPNPLSVWLNSILISVATFQPSRFQNQTLAVDPFAASLAVFDYLFAESDQPPVIASVLDHFACPVVENVSAFVRKFNTIRHNQGLLPLTKSMFDRLGLANWSTHDPKDMGMDHLVYASTNPKATLSVQIKSHKEIVEDDDIYDKVLSQRAQSSVYGADLYLILLYGDKNSNEVRKRKNGVVRLEGEIVAERCAELRRKIQRSQDFRHNTEVVDPDNLAQVLMRLNMDF